MTNSFTFAVLCSALVLSGRSAPAQTEIPAETEIIGVWQIECDDTVCQAFFNLASEGGDTFLSWSLLNAGDEGGVTSIIRVPLSVALPPGLRVFVDETTFFEAAYQVCEEEGCSAILPMGDDVLQAFAGVETVNIAVIPYGRDQPVALEAPVTGMAEAIEALVR